MSARLRSSLVACVLALASAQAFAWGGAPDWLKALAKQPVPSYESNVPGVLLLDESTTTVTGRGEIRTRYRRVYRILTTEGRDLAYATVHFDADTSVRDFRAWSITAKGEEYEVKDRDAVETASFDGELYADHKAKVIHIPAADPGSTIAYEFEQRDRPEALQLTWHYQTSIPVRVARCSVVLPEGWTYEEHWFNGNAATPHVAGNTTTWELHDVAAVKDEPRRPSVRAIAGRLSINFIAADERQASKTHRTWSDVGHWYGALVTDRRAATPAMQAKVRELTASKTTTVDKMRALAAFAQRDVRYVAIEIGAGGYVPHRASEVFDNRFGDCKDKVTLLGAMLHELGIDSYYVLISTDRGVVDKQFATIDDFNHAIIAIRLPDDVKPAALAPSLQHAKLGRLLLFDPTNSTTPLGSVPSYLQQSSALLVTPDGGELIDVAKQAPDAAQLRVTGKLALDTAGTLAGDVREVRSGWIASDMRAWLKTVTESERTSAFEKRLAAEFSERKLENLAVDNLDDPNAELVIRYHITVPSYAKKASGLLLVRPRVLGRKGETIADVKTRTYGYVLDGPSLEVDEFDIALPDGIAADELPSAAHVTHPALTYTSATTLEAKTLRYRRELKVDSFGVSADQTADLNKAFAQILADERSSAVLKRE